ncbi:MAG: S-adenosylmethionine decarboxylase [Fibrobacterota bacterium]
MKSEIFELSCWIDSCDPGELKLFFSTALGSSGFSQLCFSDHYFTPQGYTALWLLGESHLAVHTFPENGNTYLQLSSCSKPCYNRFARFLRERGNRDFKIISCVPENLMVY